MSVGVLFLLGVGYLLMPLDDADWDISENIDAQQKKWVYLNQLRKLRDSVDTRPNIVLIMADDLGISDVSINGNQLIETPNIDQIAREGIQYKNAYCTSPICATSRAALLTGRYQNRFGFENQMQRRYPKNRMELLGAKYFIHSDPWHIRWNTNTPSQESMEKQGLPQSEISIAEILKYGAGYATACIGKWHLGSSQDKKPLDFGFDYHYGFYNSHSLYISEKHEEYIDKKIAADWTDQFIWESQRKGTSAIVRNDQIVNEENYLTDVIAEESVQFIQKNANRPFFLYIPFNAPHTPLQAPKALYNQLTHILDPVRRTYQAMIWSMDLAVGRILKSLDENDLTDNTIVVFISDNGGAHYTTTTSNDPYKGGKVTQFEGGLRIPYYLKWGDKYRGTLIEERVSIVDIVRTIADVVNLPLADDRTYDGLNLFEIPTTVEANQRTLHWKVGKSNTIISGAYKLIYSTEEDGHLRLYNLNTDPEERNDLSQDLPEIVNQLHKEQEQWSEQLPSPLWPGVIKFKEEDNGDILYFES